MDKDLGHIAEKLIAYLRDKFKNPHIAYRAPLMQLQGGYETSIYRLTLRGVGDELSQCLVLRLYPLFYGTHRALWESTVQNVLAREGFPVARAHIVCTDMSILGGAFFIMDYLSGQPLMMAPPDTVPALLGKTHAALHSIDPQPLIRTLQEQGIDDSGYSLNSRFDLLKEKARTLPWIREGVRWLIEHRPPEPECLAVCHGDFHPLNILVEDGTVTGVLDWPGFAITDPAFDVANTLVLTTIPAKHLAVSWEGFSSVDWDAVAEGYVSAYRLHRHLDSTNVAYYRVRRCVAALIEGVEGQKVWQHPLIVNDLIGYIHHITGIQITISA